MNGNGPPNQPSSVTTNAVFKRSEPVPNDAVEIKGLDFDEFAARPITVEELISGMANSGLQASSIAEATRIINSMITWRDPSNPNTRTKILLGFTSNLVSSGLREVIRYLVQHQHVHGLVTSAGGVEEDLIKCLAPAYMGSFSAAGSSLRDKGINRIGNIFMPNDNYCKFEDWIIPIFERMLHEQEASRTAAFNANQNLKNPNDYQAPLDWTPSKIIERLGKELNDDRSICTWASRNQIPIFCPALTDGSLGDMLYMFSYKASPRKLVVDIGDDIRRINDLAMKAPRVGIIILGGGVIKHHIANACLMRDGAEDAVFINTGNELDGSDAGAQPDEAVSWGKIKNSEDGGQAVKVFGEASTLFPMIVASTFVKADRESKRKADA